MFDWNHDGKIDGGDFFMDFMIFNQVMNGERKEQRDRAAPNRGRVNEPEEFDAMDDEDE